MNAIMLGEQQADEWTHGDEDCQEQYEMAIAPAEGEGIGNGELELGIETSKEQVKG
jgi:hypothetical protein